MNVTKLEVERVGTWANKVLDVARPSPGNMAQFKATITPNTVNKPIKFVLVGTSKEVGTNMNTGTQTSFDLTFENQTGFTNPIGAKQEIVETPGNGADNSATVKVTAQDYGPHGKIKAVIDLGVGLLCEGAELSVILDDNPDGGNMIEDAWDTAFPAPAGGSLAATDDSDNEPTGDGNRGGSSREQRHSGPTPVHELHPRALWYPIVALETVQQPIIQAPSTQVHRSLRALSLARSSAERDM